VKIMCSYGNERVVLCMTNGALTLRCRLMKRLCYFFLSFNSSLCCIYVIVALWSYVGFETYYSTKICSGPKLVGICNTNFPFYTS
jgi:hypothetical protein